MGNNDGLVLALDVDGLIFNSNGKIEEAVAKVDYRCSKRYIECIKECAQRKEYEITERYFWEDHETYDRLIDELRKMVDRYVDISRISFDEVVEEVFPFYQGKIDYDSIYTLENVYSGVMEKIRELYFSGIFRKIYICTHCNSANERAAKKRFFKKYFNERGVNVEIVFVPFHDMPYIYDSSRYFENRERKRTNKAAYFFSITEESPIDTIFIDDSPEICDEAEIIGAKAFCRNRRSNDPIHPFTEMEEFLKAKRKKKRMSE